MSVTIIPPQNNQHFLYPNWHISIEEDVVVKYKTASLNWAKRQQGSLKSKKIAWVRGYEFDKDFLNGVPLQKVEVDSVKQGVQLLEKGRIDALVDYESSLSQFSRLSSNSSFTTETVKPGERLYVVFSNTAASKPLIEAFDQAMERLVNEGTIEQLYSLYNLDYDRYQQSLKSNPAASDH